jgi:hypothetical protein
MYADSLCGVCRTIVRHCVPIVHQAVEANGYGGGQKKEPKVNFVFEQFCFAFVQQFQPFLLQAGLAIALVKLGL